MKASKIIEGAMLAAAAGTAAATGKFLRTFRVKKDRKEHVSPYQDVLEEGKKWLKKMEPQSEYFMLQSFDGLTLTARMIPADKDCGRVVLAVHGYKGSGGRGVPKERDEKGKEGFGKIQPSGAFRLLSAGVPPSGGSGASG